eukprot:Colp12_sorted_trinity150504_noHs@18334
MSSHEVPLHNVKEFRDTFFQILYQSGEADGQGYTPGFIHPLMYHDATEPDLEQVCSLDSLKCPLVPENPDEFQFEQIPQEQRPRSFEHLVKKKPMKRPKQYVAALTESEVTAGGGPIRWPEVILNVALYHPERPLKLQEFQVLGSQLLTELCDHLYCPVDEIVEKSAPGNPKKGGSFFFIENVFYNDNRPDETGNKKADYSEKIREWALDPNRSLPEYGAF